MLSIAVMLHIEYTYGDYTSAGIVLAAMSIGQGVAGPLLSRWLGVWGMRPVLLLTTAVSSTAMLVVALAPLPLAVISGVAFIMGITTPPVTASVRTLYPKMVPGNQIAPLFSLDAALQEIIWIIGPVLAVFIAAFLSPPIGLLVAASFMVGGGIWYITAPELGKVRIPRARRRIGAVLTHSAVLTSTIIGFLFIASFAAFEIGIVSIYGHAGIESGIILAVFSLGSLLGGVTIGKRAPGPFSLGVRSGIVLIGTVPTMFTQNVWLLCLFVFIGGLGVAPMISSLYTMVSASVKFSETAESYGWMQTGHLIGAAVGSAIAGVAIDGVGPVGGITIAVVFLTFTVIASLVTVRWIPDLRGREATPIPDTEPVMIPIQPPVTDSPEHNDR